MSFFCSPVQTTGGSRCSGERASALRHVGAERSGDVRHHSSVHCVLDNLVDGHLASVERLDHECVEEDLSVQPPDATVVLGDSADVYSRRWAEPDRSTNDGVGRVRQHTNHPAAFVEEHGDAIVLARSRRDQPGCQRVEVCAGAHKVTRRSVAPQLALDAHARWESQGLAATEYNTDGARYTNFFLSPTYHSTTMRDRQTSTEQLQFIVTLLEQNRISYSYMEPIHPLHGYAVSITKPGEFPKAISILREKKIIVEKVDDIVTDRYRGGSRPTTAEVVAMPCQTRACSCMDLCV